MKIFLTLEQKREFYNGGIVEVSTIPDDNTDSMLVGFNEVMSMNNSPFVMIQKKY